MSKVSVYVIAYNDEPNMRACLESVAGWADELIVVDSHSTDGTAAIAAEFTKKIYQVDFAGFGALRNQAIGYCSHEWIFSLDTDERMTPALQEEIRQVLARPNPADAYFVPRKNFFLGRWIKHCGWYPDHVLRLFRREAGRFSDNLVHERVIVDGAIGTLSHHLLHYSYTEARQVEDKIQRYARAGAKEMALRGKRVSPLKPWINGGWAFVRTYFLRRGFLDGATGAAIARMNARSAFLKYDLLRRGES